MRRYAHADSPLPSSRSKSRSDWQILRSLFPYLIDFKGRVGFALLCLIGAKVANLGVPVLMKHIVDHLTGFAQLSTLARAQQTPALVMVGGVGLLVVAYGVLRLSTSLFTELREILFSKVTESAVRQIALKVFRHLHSLSLRFHL